MEDDKPQRGFEPQKIEIDTGGEGPDGSKISPRIKVDTEDIIAIFAGIVAVIIALGMVFGTIPVNELTVGVLTFSGAGVVIAKIISARKKKNRKRN